MNLELLDARLTQTALQAVWQMLRAVPVRVPQVRFSMAPAAGASSVVGTAEEAATRRVRVARTLKRILIDWLGIGYLKRRKLALKKQVEDVEVKWSEVK